MAELLSVQDELIVVDQTGDPRLREVCTRGEQLIYFGMPVPSLTRARNAGIALASHEIILFIDDDVIPEPLLIECHRKMYSDRELAGVAGRIRELTDVKGSDLTEKDLRDETGFWEIRFDHEYDGNVPTARGCNMSFRREWLLAVGGFDTWHAPPFSFREDTDVCYRIRRSGGKLKFCAGAMLTHVGSAIGGTRPVSPTHGLMQREFRDYQQHFKHRRDHLYFLFKHFSGAPLARNLYRSYRTYGNLSRWPWRLAAKHVLFLAATAQAWWWSITVRPPFFEPLTTIPNKRET